MIIALASPRVASSIEEGLDKIKQSLSEAAAQQEGVLVQAINREAATGLLASRYAPERYQEFIAE